MPPAPRLGERVQTMEETSGGWDATRQHSNSLDEAGSSDGSARGAPRPPGADDDAGEGDDGGDDGDGGAEESGSSLSLKLRPSDEERDGIAGLRARDGVQRAARGGRWLEDSEMLRFVRARKTLDESEVRPTTRPEAPNGAFAIPFAVEPDASALWEKEARRS